MLNIWFIYQGSIGTSNALLSGGNEYRDVLQLYVDNCLLAVQMKVSVSLAKTVTNIQMAIHNRFRVHVNNHIFPKFVDSFSASTSSTSTNFAQFPMGIFDPANFIEELEPILGDMREYKSFNLLESKCMNKKIFNFRRYSSERQK